MKAMVIYCSHTGITERIARRIAADFACPILKVEPDVVYGSFLSACKRVVSDRLKKQLPGAVTETPQLEGFDTIFIGYPIWAGDMPDFMQSFLRRCALSGKRIIPFATFRMTDIAASLDTLAALCPGAEILDPFNYGIMHRERYADWLEMVRADCAERDMEARWDAETE